MIRILIADDHAVVRRGLKQIVSEQGDMTVVGEAATIPELIERVRKHRYDIVVLDIGMPGRGGLDALRQIKRERPRLPVLVLSVYPEDQFAVRTLKLGAAGYLTKDSAPENLVSAIRKAVAGGKYLSPALAENLADSLAQPRTELPHEGLSNREYQIMRLIASGRSPTEVAKTLSLSVKTISTYRSRVLAKMNMKTNAQLTRYAIIHGLID